MERWWVGERLWIKGVFDVKGGICARALWWKRTHCIEELGRKQSKKSGDVSAHCTQTLPWSRNPEPSGWHFTFLWSVQKAQIAHRDFFFFSLIASAQSVWLPQIRIGTLHSVSSIIKALRSSFSCYVWVKQRWESRKCSQWKCFETIPELLCLTESKSESCEVAYYMFLRSRNNTEDFRLVILMKDP